MNTMKPSKYEQEVTDRWAEIFAGNDTKTPPPFSFIYNGCPSGDFLSTWPRKVQAAEADEFREKQTVVYTDPDTGLEIRSEVIRYKDFPAIEWVLYFKNTGTCDTPIIEKIQAMDINLSDKQEYTLRYSKGSSCGEEDFAPLKESFHTWGNSLHLAPEGGRSSSGILPFFNLCQDNDKHGIILAIGWSGQWAAKFERTESGDMQMQVGLELTHLKLHPGEEIRTPRILTLFWEKDRLRAHNLLRRLLLKHHRPSVNGQPCTTPLSNMNWGGTSEEVHLDNIQKMLQHDLPFDHYWIDAEWYGKPWPDHVGTWKPRKDLYPDGFKPISKSLHKAGRKFLLWFESERVAPDSDWGRDHKNLLLTLEPDENTKNKYAVHSLLNLGNPETRRFLTDFVSEKITEFGIDCYRQDFNIDPLKHWRAADAPDRQGITESKYIEGLYLFWDELLRRHPHLIIDNCASGGRRIDLETTGRSIPLWRTDFAGYSRERDNKEVAAQCHTHGLFHWVPLNASGGFIKFNDYAFRSWMSSGMGLRLEGEGDNPQEPIPDEFPFETLGRQLRQYQSIRKYYEGDYYPLTEYSQAEDAWMVYQLDRPDLNEGLIVVLKRPKSPFPKAVFSLHALNPKADYQLTNLDDDSVTITSGRHLLNRGFEIELPDNPDSALVTYKEIK